MDINEIVERVKQEAERYDFVEKNDETNVHHHSVDDEFVNKHRYHVSELLNLDQEIMVDTLYRCILKREPDPDALTFKQQLLSGDLSPISLIDNIRYSSEGCEKNVTVKGLRTRLFIQQFKRIPLMGRSLRILGLLVKLPDFVKQVDQLSVTQRSLCQAVHQKADKNDLHQKADKNDLHQKADKNDLHQKADRDELYQKADRDELYQKADKNDLHQKADKNELKAYRESIRYVERYFHYANRELQQLIHQLTSLDKPEVLTGTCVAQQLEQLAESEYDKLYLDFEYLYRGTPQMVAQLLTSYQELLDGIKQASDPETELLAVDLGCGRGEMVHYLGQRGYNATGVDLNRLAIMTCHEHNINATQANALHYLNNLQHGTVSVVSTLHLVEHLSNDELFQLIKRSMQVLKPGGMLLIETPNPRNLLVGSGDFYRDFSHNKPLFPDTLRFLLNYFGFNKTEIFYFEQSEDDSRRLTNADDMHFNDLSDYLQISRDYAVVGYKPCE